MMTCQKGLDIKPMHSHAGWYLGTETEDGQPNCRLTSTYAIKEEGATALPIDREDAMENIYCNKCGNCHIIWEKKYRK